MVILRGPQKNGKIMGGFVEKLLTEQEAEVILGMSRGFLRKNRCTHKPHPIFIKIGKAVRYRSEDIQKFIEERFQPGI